MAETAFLSGRGEGRSLQWRAARHPAFPAHQPGHAALSSAPSSPSPPQAPTLGLAEVQGVVDEGHPRRFPRVHLAPSIVVALLVAPALRRVESRVRLLGRHRRQRKQQQPTEGQRLQGWRQPPPAPSAPPPFRAFARRPQQQPLGLHGSRRSQRLATGLRHGKKRSQPPGQQQREAVATARAAVGGGTRTRPTLGDRHACTAAARPSPLPGPRGSSSLSSR